MATRPTLPAGLDFRLSHTITRHDEYNTYGREKSSKTDRLHDKRVHSTPSWNRSGRTETILLSVA